MRLEKRKPSGREKDEAAITLLEQLREKVHGDDISFARRAAFRLSWMQEDGLDILKEALLSDTPERTKNAAAYGMRKMHGRMKKMAVETLQQNKESDDDLIAEVCQRALDIMEGKIKPKRPFRKDRGGPRKGKFNIKTIPRKGGRFTPRPKTRIRPSHESRRPHFGNYP